MSLKHTPKAVETAFIRNQKCSPLLRLPTEMRNKICDLVLAKQYIHIHYKPHVHRYRQKNHVRYKEHIPGGWLHEAYPEDEFTSSREKQYKMKRTSQLTILSGVCRQLYHDTALYHFSGNIFSFGNSWEMKKFLKERQGVQKRAIKRMYIGGSITKTLQKELKGLHTVYRPYVGSAEQVIWEGLGVQVIFTRKERIF